MQRLLRYRWLLFLLLFAVLPFSIRGAIKAWESNANRVVDWMPDDFEATRELEQFIGLFGSDELLMISWPECTLDDPRIEKYRSQLLAPVETEDGSRTYFREVLSGPEILKHFEDPPLKIKQDEAFERMTGWILSADHKQTCLIALVSYDGAADRHAAVAHAREISSRVSGLSAEDVFLAGPTIEGVAIDEVSQKYLFLLNLGSFAISIVVMILTLRSIRASLLIFLIAVFNEQLSLAIIYYCGTPLNSILLLTANLTFILTISVGIHLVNYYKDALQTHGPQDAPLEAFRRAWTPTVLATLTTALGLASLMVSEIKPIVAFGGYSAICVILSMGITLFYVTAHFQVWPLRLRKKTLRAYPKTAKEVFAASTILDGQSVFGRVQKPTNEEKKNPVSLSVWISTIRLCRWPLLLGAVAILIGGYLGVQRLETSVGLEDLVAPETRIVQDYHWLEKHIGPLVPIEVVVEMPASDARGMMAQFRGIAKLHQTLHQNDPELAVISSATFVPSPPPEKGGFRQFARAAAFRRQLLASQKDLSDLGYLHATEKRNYWRITIRTAETSNTDYGQLIAKVQQTVDTTFADGKFSKPIEVTVAGGVPLIYQAQQQLLEDLIQSFLLAFGLVSLALMTMFRNILCGLICMIPNILPSALVFGFMGWREIPIEIGAILTASTALGIAVDDSLHFITWFRYRIRDGATIREAILFSYRHCATAMVQTTLICTLGLVIFSLSQFTPIAKFGWCMFTLLIVALVADLIVLPAILLSPLGRPFLPRRSLARPRSLRAFAFTVAAPRELLLSLMLGTIIAMGIFKNIETVTLVGWSSLLLYYGPMSFILPFLTTCFGYLSGCTERCSGRATPAWIEGTHWRRNAIFDGICCGLIICPVSIGLLFLLNLIMPDLSLSKWEAVITAALISGILDYFLHARAVIRSGRLGNKK